MTNRSRHIATIALLATLAGAATAQDQTSTDADLLRGPAVTDNHVPGASDSFAGRPMAGGAESRPDERPISMREFIQSVRSLERPGVAEELRLNEGQIAVVDVMLREHREAMAAWNAEHGQELRRLRVSKRPGDQARGRRGASDPARKDERARAGQPIDRRIDRTDKAERLDNRADRGNRRAPLDENTKEELKALMQTRPSAEPQQAQIWEVLTPEQQAFVENDVQRRRADAITQRDMRQQQKQDQKTAKVERRESKQARKGKREGRGLPADMTVDEFKQKMLERIEALPPEQQEKALERLNRALQRFEQTQQRRNRNNA